MKTIQHTSTILMKSLILRRTIFCCLVIFLSLTKSYSNSFLAQTQKEIYLASNKTHIIDVVFDHHGDLKKETIRLELFTTTAGIQNITYSISVNNTCGSSTVTVTISFDYQRGVNEAQALNWEINLYEDDPLSDDHLGLETGSWPSITNGGNWIESATAVFTFNGCGEIGPIEGNILELIATIDVDGTELGVIHHEEPTLGNATIDEDSCACVLPVELVYFETDIQDEQVLLIWETVSEVNNDGFEIQRSSAAKDWEVLDFVEGQGTTTEPQSYTFLDKTPLSGQNYYRLRQIDIDGNSEFSPIEVVQLHHKSITVSEVFPNPVSHSLANVTIQTPTETDMKLTIYDLMGRAMWQESNSLPEGLSQVVIDLSQLSAGTYWLQLQLNGELFFNKIGLHK